MGGNVRPPHETFIQIADNGARIAADDLRKAIGASAALHHTVLRYAHTLMIQTTHTALANGRSKIDEAWPAGF